MKTIKHICQVIVLLATIFLWIVFICGADSLAETGYLDIAFVIVALTTGICCITIDDNDVKTIFKIKDDETV